jgi:peptidoglycan/xylan/chitin deacetylase (PgdA/CDA1 family)
VRGDRRDRVDDAAVHALARGIAAEHEEGAGVAMYLALADPAPADPAPTDPAPADPAPADRTGPPPPADDGAALAAELERWHALLDLDDGSDAVQHVVAALAAARVRPGPPLAPPSPIGVSGPLVVPPNYAPSRPGALAGVLAAWRAGRLVRVVNYHNTPAAAADRLAAELAAYAARYRPLRAEDLHALIDGEPPPDDRPGLVVAFFDGYRNTVDVAAPLCEAAGVPGWFLPPTGFLDTPPDGQRDWAARHDMDLLPEERDGTGRIAMTWDELAGLAERGHVVGAHTAGHVTAASVTTPADVDREVLAPVRRLAAVTGRPPAAFAWLGGTPDEPDTPAGRALRDSGVRLHLSGLAVERIA